MSSLQFLFPHHRVAIGRGIAYVSGGGRREDLTYRGHFSLDFVFCAFLLDPRESVEKVLLRVLILPQERHRKLRQTEFSKFFVYHLQRLVFLARYENRLSGRREVTGQIRNR